MKFLKRFMVSTERLIRQLSKDGNKRLSMFLSVDKSAKQTVNLIENRVNLYLSENS